MSEVDEAKKMLNGINTDVKSLQESVKTMADSSASKQELADIAIKMGNLEKALDKKDEEMEKLVKSIESEKLKTKTMASIDSSEQKRSECIEFLKGLRDIANPNSGIQSFNTSEFKSTKELLERKDYGSFNDAQGGVAVIPALDALLDKLVRESSDVRSLSSVSTISTDKWEQLKMNQSNGAQWEKNMANFATGTKNNTFSKLNILVNNLHGIAVFSDDLINDNAFNLVGEVLMSLAEDMAIAEGTSFWSGNGNGELSGILNAPDAANSFDSIERISTAASNVISFEDIYDLIGALIQPYEAGAQFKAHRLTIQTLRKLRAGAGGADGEGAFLWQPSNIVGVPATLAGYPISQATELSSTPLVNNTEAIVFGNFKQAYKIVDRMGITVMRDQYTVYPNVSFKAKKRVGGGVQKGAALKILKTLTA